LQSELQLAHLHVQNLMRGMQIENVLAKRTSGESLGQTFGLSVHEQSRARARPLRTRHEDHLLHRYASAFVAELHHLP
jgi:hypothetical protein